MSYFYYLACSRELTAGTYALPPKTIYPSYAAFMDSEDYRLHEQAFRSSELLNKDAGKLCDLRRAVGKVHVFQRLRDSRCVEIYPFPAACQRTQEEESIAAWFSLPYLYQVDEFAPDLLCKYLRPDDRVEFLSVFLGHEEPIRKPVVGTTDLQDYADGRLDRWEMFKMISTPPDNNLTCILPPSTQQTKFDIRFTDFSEVFCTVFLDSAEVYWNWESLRLQGFL